MKKKIVKNENNLAMRMTTRGKCTKELATGFRDELVAVCLKYKDVPMLLMQNLDVEIVGVLQMPPSPYYYIYGNNFVGKDNIPVGHIIALDLKDGKTEAEHIRE